MTRPREILPGRFHMLTRRCTQRQFLLRPDPETNNAFIYCLGEAASRFAIDVVYPQQMSNHHHTTIFDRGGTVIEFMEHFHKMLARSQNALRGRWENFWSSQPPGLLHLVDPDDVFDKIAYSVTNPVKAGLVEESLEWPGISSYEALLEGKAMHAHRPAHFFRSNGPMPAEVSLELVIPPELGNREEFLRRLRDRVKSLEATYSEKRARTGVCVLGRHNVLRQKWESAPKSPAPRRKLNPRIAARCWWRRLEAIRRNKEFEAAYNAARLAMLSDRPIPFPPGTYWLRRFVGVPVESKNN